MGLSLSWVWMSAATLLACYVFLNQFVRRLNGWYYDLKLGKQRRRLLPPGDMGWPLIGSLIPFMRGLSSGNADSFIDSLFSRYGPSGIYKTHLFGKPSIFICTPEMCKQVLTDDKNFKTSYPKSFIKLLKSKIFSADVSNTEHKHVRRIASAPILGHNVLAVHVEHTEKVVINLLEELSSMKHPIELWKEIEKVPLNVIVQIIMGSSHNPSTITKVKDLVVEMFNCNPFFSVAIDLPGFTFHKALKVRNKLFETLLSAVNERRLMMKNGQIEEKKDLIHILLEAKGENGEEYEDKEIVDLLITIMMAGHESTTLSLLWSIMYLTQHPDVFRKAKEEQEEIVKARPPSQKHLSYKEIKQMVYLSQVINEMLRHAGHVLVFFRETISDVNINGCIIPKGWTVIGSLRALHMNPENYPNPKEFNPSRWEDLNVKAGTFLPFGLGSRLCPGKDIANLEISIFLHYFLLHYRLEHIKPEFHVPIVSFSRPKYSAKVIKVA